MKRLHEAAHVRVSDVHVVQQLERHYQRRLGLLQALAGDLVVVVPEAGEPCGLAASQFGLLLCRAVAQKYLLVETQVLCRRDDIARDQKPFADSSESLSLLRIQFFTSLRDFEADCSHRLLRVV